MINLHRATANPDTASHALALPRPTGPHPVGREALHLVTTPGPTRGCAGRRLAS